MAQNEAAACPPAHPPRRLRVVLGLVLTVALVVVVLSLSAAVAAERPSLWHVPLAAAAMAIGEVPLLYLRFGHHRESFALGEAAAVVSLALLPLPWLAPVGGGAVLALYLLQRRPLVKAAYNASVTAIGLAAGGITVHVAGGQITFSDLRVLAAVAGGGLFYGLWSMVAVSTVVSASSGVPLRVKLRQGRRLRAAFVVANTVLGLGVLALAHWSPLTLLVLPPVLLALVLAHRTSLRSLEQGESWRHLNAAAKELVHLDEPTIVGQARERARQLFRPDDVELVLQSSAADLYPLPNAPSQERKTRRVEHVAAPLRSANGPVGVLRLRFAEPVEWSDHEDQVLSAFAHTVSSALVNARLYAEARQQAQEKAHEAAHDALTGLGNRRLLLDQAAEVLRVAKAERGCIGLLLIDLDRFKEVNDTLGHNAGDRLLCGVAERLRRSVRSADLVARLGGDEFAVLVSGICGPAAAESVASELAEVIARPATFDGMTLAVEGSVGVACFPEDGQTVEELLQRADVAMYQAKASNERYMRYRADRDDSTLDRLELVAELRSALSGGELVLHYQPQLDLHTGQVARVEALVRWEHPRRGLLGPERFVPVIEQTGLVRDFTGSVLDEALSACAGWKAEGLDVGVAVNLSARNLLDSSLPGEVARLLLRHKVPAEELTLELTETAVMADLDAAEQILANLRDLGVQLAVDDFGTGYSSLTLLQRFALNEVKVDRGFVQDLLVERSNAAIVQVTIQLAHTLGLRVVAEGVENPQLVEALVALECDLAQGNHIGMPMAARELREWLHDSDRIAVRQAPHARVLPWRARRGPASG